MADPKNKQTAQGVFPDATTPTIFADTVTNLARNEHLVRFYLARSDPDAESEGNNRLSLAAQVVMSISSFVETAVFFDRVLKDAVGKGAISQESIDRVVNALNENEK